MIKMQTRQKNKNVIVILAVISVLILYLFFINFHINNTEIYTSKLNLDYLAGAPAYFVFNNSTIQSGINSNFFTYNVLRGTYTLGGKYPWSIETDANPNPNTFTIPSMNITPFFQKGLDSLNQEPTSYNNATINQTIQIETINLKNNTSEWYYSNLTFVYANGTPLNHHFLNWTANPDNSFGFSPINLNNQSYYENEYFQNFWRCVPMIMYSNNASISNLKNNTLKQTAVGNTGEYQTTFQLFWHNITAYKDLSKYNFVEGKNFAVNYGNYSGYTFKKPGYYAFGVWCRGQEATFVSQQTGNIETEWMSNFRTPIYQGFIGGKYYYVNNITNSTTPITKIQEQESILNYIINFFKSIFNLIKAKI